MRYKLSQITFCMFSTVYLVTQASEHSFGRYEPPKLEGESCGQVNGRKWTCQKETNCDLTSTPEPYASSIVICNDQEKEKILCCPRPEKEHTISEKKCQEYEAKICRTRRSSRLSTTSSRKTLRGRLRLSTSQDSAEQVPRMKRQLENEEDTDESEIFDPNPDTDNSTLTVHNGKNALAGEFPYAARLGVGFKSPTRWICGGTLVSEIFVLSAAHCTLVEAKWGPLKWIRIGDLDFSTDSDRTKPQDFSIVQIIVHPKFKRHQVYNDIALFRLNKAAVFSQFVAPACLHQSLSDYSGTVTAAGWGWTDNVKVPSPKLMKVDLRTLATEECNRRIIQSEMDMHLLPLGVNESTMICAWETDRDTCEGDSGGPLILTNSKHCPGQVVGITSFGIGTCGYDNTFGVYTRVSAFLPWLESIVWPN